MELKRRLDPRVFFTGLYILAFAVYLIIGLQPAEAAHYDVSAQLEIPSIGLDADVTTLERHGRQLETPDTIAGSYSESNNKTLLIGHSTTVFENLDQVKLGDTIGYNNKQYRVVALDTVPKSQVRMGSVLADEERDTIIVMTCAGELLGGGDATHRLMVTAVSD